MAEANISVNHCEFFCPVCYDLLKNPVTIRCGHSFCEVCINQCWDQEDKNRVYSCPLCRDSSTPRPVLYKNKILAEVVKKLEEIDVSFAHCFAGPGDVKCSFCTGRKRKAVKSCLMCLASFCETHLKPHYEVSGLKKHVLIEATANLEERICSEHGKVLEVYCHTDQCFICCMCMTEKHQSHDTVSVEAYKTEKLVEFREKQRKSQQRIESMQKKVQELKLAMKTVKLSAQSAVDNSAMICTELISSIDKKRLEVMELIRAQEKAKLRRGEQLIKELEGKTADLQGKLTELRQLSHSRDHVHFLQRLESLCVSSGHEDSLSITVNQHFSFVGVRKSLSNLKRRFEEFCQEEFMKIPENAAAVQMLLPTEPKKREDFLHYFCDLTLDPNTVNNKIILFEKNKVVMHSGRKQQYSHHPERFDYCKQVLSKESVCGRCYWEVEWCSKEWVEISVSYMDISRKGWGNMCEFGCNDQSWKLQCSSTSLSFYHKNKRNNLRISSAYRIGVYVDHSAGTLSFYSVSDTMKLLHRVHSTFTQPLYAGFGLPHRGSIVRLCDE
ncbi:tripartite motif-containing protein 16-like [Clarias gariepinus]|uniref:tripartite motif-containing protein 16-like n=1 Tax=Clarias gariepinus TaxID=13013 RepID=UPI00234C17AC|nr:tripartite motif-containing protein 16-like [Clarias gariepinus]